MAKGGGLGVTESCLESGITCALCLDIYKDPKILPCGHIYCKTPCLTELARQTNNISVTCPECRTISEVPHSDVTEFATVYKILNLVDSYQEKKEQCCSAPATCEAHYEELTVFCETCSQMLCTDCIIDTKTHQDHAYGYIKKYRKKFHQILETSRQLITTRMSVLLSKVEHCQLSVSCQYEELSKKIDEEIDKKAEEKKVSVRSSLDLIASKKHQMLKIQHEKLSELNSNSCNILWATENVLQNVPDSEFSRTVRVVRSLEDHVNNIAENPNLIGDLDNAISLHICPNPHTPNQLYVVGGTKADPSECKWSSRGNIQEVQIDEVVTISIDSFGTACLHEQTVTAELHRLCDLTFVQLPIHYSELRHCSVEFTPTHRGRHMLAIKVNGSHIMGSPTSMFVHMPPQRLDAPVATITSLKRPGGMLSWNGRILACEHEKNRLVEVDRKYETVSEVAIVDGGPAGLTADSTGALYVTTFLDHRLRKLSKDGTFLKGTGSYGSGDRHFNMANGVKVFNNKVYVCDSKNHRIKVYDLELNLLEIFGKKGSGLGQFRKPIDLVFDEGGAMYVTDQQNERIQVFSSSREPIREFLLSDPVTIHILNSYLFVTQYTNNCVSVITTQGEKVATFGERYLHHPEELRTDQDGFVYVTSHENQILVF